MRVMLIDDDVTIARMIEKVLVREGHEVELEKSGEVALQRLETERYEMVLTDLQLPGMSGLTLIESEVMRRLACPVVLITGFGTTETAILAMRAGAFDYLTKPFEVDDLLRVVGRVQASLRPVKPLTVSFDRFQVERDSIVGQCRAMQEVYKAIGKVAATSATALILGETGTGKELVARALHQYSKRSEGAFVVVNCGAIPESLIESELFGHEKGAFTGAVAKRKGRLEQASGGTLFLDEVGELPLATQVKLLRFLQDKTVQPVGGNTTVQLDVRLISATNRDLVTEVRKGRFREDLYYRLNVARITLPPLRDRSDDILLLLNYFNQKSAATLNGGMVRFSGEAIAMLRAYRWPGNVRQLENLLKQLIVNAHNGFVGGADVEPLLSGVGTSSVSEPTAVDWQALLDRAIRLLVADPVEWGQGRLWERAKEAAESALLEQALERTKGHQSDASRKLGITMKTLRDKLAHRGMDARQFKETSR